MIHLIDRRQSQERRWLNERRGHVPIIDRRNYPPIVESACPVIRKFGGAGDYQECQRQPEHSAWHNR